MYGVSDTASRHRLKGDIGVRVELKNIKGEGKRKKKDDRHQYPEFSSQIQSKRQKTKFKARSEGVCRRLGLVTKMGGVTKRTSSRQ